MPKMEELYETFSDGEKRGLAFGMFPADKIQSGNISREEVLDLLAYAKQKEYK